MRSFRCSQFPIALRGRGGIGHGATLQRVHTPTSYSWERIVRFTDFPFQRAASMTGTLKSHSMCTQARVINPADSGKPSQV